GGAEAGGALAESRHAIENAEGEQEDVALAVARERRQLASILSKEIEWIDKRIVSMAQDAMKAQSPVRDEKMRDVETSRAWRERLQADLEAVRSPTPEQDWSTMKRRVEADLDEGRPVGLPRSWEKPYGI